MIELIEKDPIFWTAIIGLIGTFTGVLMGWIFQMIIANQTAVRQNYARFHQEKYKVYLEFMSIIRDGEKVLFPENNVVDDNRIIKLYEHIQIFYPKLILVSSPTVLSAARTFFYAVYSRTKHNQYVVSASGGQAGYGKPATQKEIEGLQIKLINKIRKEFSLKTLEEFQFTFLRNEKI